MSETRVIVNGLGRSGTSWVLKVFDHHPAVFAAHEPDLTLPAHLRSAGPDDPDGLNAETEALFASRTLRAMRKRPVMTKSYRSAAAHWARYGYMVGASALARFTPGQRGLNWPVPDFARLDTATAVVKTVKLQLVLAQIAVLKPDVKIVFVVRHPCGWVASRRRGIEAGKMTDAFLPPRDLLDGMYDFGRPVEELSEDDFTPAQILSYRWAVYNDPIVRAAARLPNVRIVRYEDLCDSPRAAFMDLFDWVGLSWDDRCDAFISASLAKEDDARAYHALVRNSSIAAHRWKSTLSEAEQATIRRIAAGSSAAELFDDVGRGDLTAVPRDTRRAAAQRLRTMP